ncbi:MAG: hypothetical protein V3S64_12910, partial [bacterium]
MIKAVIIGAAGLSGLELIRILVRHGQVRLTAISSGRYKGQRAGEAFPELSRVGLTFMDHDEVIAGIANGGGDELLVLHIPEFRRVADDCTRSFTPDMESGLLGWPQLPVRPTRVYLVE